MKSKQPESDITVEPLAESCCVCDRPIWGDYQPLGYGAWRHAECFAGSKAWREQYRLKGKDTIIGQCYGERKGGEAHESSVQAETL